MNTPMTDQEIKDFPTNPSMAITTTATISPATIRVLVPSWCKRILFLRLFRIAGLDEDFLLCPDFFFRLIMGFHFSAVANGTHNFAKIHI